ncbi:MAG: HEPN domain-containing protein [Candidatus Berkelbacteria bacterium Licking1014_2]|uniref:HEPN domain-containing protein n=1 Tax=Candidatus Berkelbacteria bacterium Licking1014_2 TaxID=2017146 RepID=A0A554LSR3_9BACT|nr:MAG: HEPN domain-containing protein [Candidatus Berkelbacteria bacterium Licking1014_2]
MSKKEAIVYWLRVAKRDRQTAQSLFKLGYYHWSLFMWQLVIERLLKGLITMRDKEVVPIHNLVRLAKIAGLKPSPQQIDDLTEITTFNLETRYDDYKEKFYHKANKNYAIKWSQKAEEIYQWLQKQF